MIRLQRIRIDSEKENSVMMFEDGILVMAYSKKNIVRLSIAHRVKHELTTTE